MQDCNMSSTLLYDASFDGCDISAASIRWADVWELCGDSCPVPAPLMTSSAKASEAMCVRAQLEALVAEADHILKLAVEELDAGDDHASDDCGGGGNVGSRDANSSTGTMVALARSQAAAAADDASRLSRSSSSDVENMLRNSPKEVIDSVKAMVEAGQHGKRLHHLPTLMAIRCIGKAGKPLLRGMDLRFAYFCRCRLKTIDLRGCDLSSTSFIDCDLTDSKLNSARMDAVTLTGSLLHNTDFDFVELLNKARDDITDEERVVVTGCSFKPFKLSPDSTISRVDLSSCRISDAVAVNVKLQNVTLCGAKLVRPSSPRSITGTRYLTSLNHWHVRSPLRLQLCRCRCRACSTALCSAAATCLAHSLTAVRLWARDTSGV
jgi:uncharacterized protein YjbI with pentapeptide repeats